MMFLTSWQQNCFISLSLEKIGPKNFRIKHFMQKLRHQVVEAVGAEAIQKLPLTHPCWWQPLKNLQIFFLAPGQNNFKKQAKIYNY